MSGNGNGEVLHPIWCKYDPSLRVDGNVLDIQVYSSVPTTPRGRLVVYVNPAARTEWPAGQPMVTEGGLFQVAVTGKVPDGWALVAFYPGGAVEALWSLRVHATAIYGASSGPDTGVRERGFREPPAALTFPVEGQPEPAVKVWIPI